jgi:energy-converting hydrogenase Eha subunit E
MTIRGHEFGPLASLIILYIGAFVFFVISIAFTYYTGGDFNDPVVRTGFALYGTIFICGGVFIVFFGALELLGYIWRIIKETLGIYDEPDDW